MLRVALSAYLLHAGEDYRSAGVSVYASELLTHLALRDRGQEYVALVGRDAPPLPGLRVVRAPFPTESPPFRIACEQLGVPAIARLVQANVLHGTVNVLPLAYRGPTVVTVHDLAFLRHPERFLQSKATYLRFAVAASARRATRIIAVSESTRRDLVDLLAVPDDRIDVVYQGVDSRFRVFDAPLDAASLALPQDRPYILYVGTLEPRKNLDVLIAAFARLVEHGLPHRLVMVGARGWMFDQTLRLIEQMGLSQHIYMPGYVDRNDLPLWYNAADLFVYPSAYEGFGLPLLEAMACGVPCVTTSSSALIEVAGNACLMVEPGSEEDLYVTMRRVLEDPGLASDLKSRGVSRAARFTWTETAERTAHSYQAAHEASQS